jgi:cob(I)alamin adenosyltransferase
LALRAAGRGIPVYIGQFMKGQDYGELESVQWLKSVTLEQYGDPGWVRKGRIKPQQIEAAADGLARARQAMLSGKYRIVILDEIHMAVWFELVGLDAVLELLDQRPADVELILTGRNAHEAVVARAHLVTEMREVRHYYEIGVGARVGIEN